MHIIIYGICVCVYNSVCVCVQLYAYIITYVSVLTDLLAEPKYYIHYHTLLME